MTSNQIFLARNCHSITEIMTTDDSEPRLPTESEIWYWEYPARTDPFRAYDAFQWNVCGTDGHKEVRPTVVHFLCSLDICDGLPPLGEVKARSDVDWSYAASARH